MRPIRTGHDTSSPRSHRARALALAALLGLSLVAPACKPGAPGSKAGGGGGSSSKGIDVSMTIAPVDAKGQRVASVTLTTKAAIQGVQLTFEPPEGCQVVAGSLVRTLPSLQPGTPISQQVGIQCDSSAKGELKASAEGRDEKGTVLTGDASAGL